MPPFQTTSLLLPQVRSGGFSKKVIVTQIGIVCLMSPKHGHISYRYMGSTNDDDQKCVR